MGRRLRVQKRAYIYFVSNRCFQAKFLLTPDQHGTFNKMMLACLSIAQERYGVVIYGYVVMSNHFHLLIRAPNLNLSLFMKDFQSLLAKRVNALRQRTGPLFPTRFDCKIVIGQYGALEMAKYMLLNPVRAKLVASPSDWPGLISVPKNGLQPLLISRMPGFKSFKKQWRALDRAIAAALIEPKHTGPFVGADVVLNTDPFDAPANPKRERQRLCDKLCVVDPVARDVYLEDLAQVECNYRSAYDGFELSVLQALAERDKYPSGVAPPPIISPPDALPFLLWRRALSRIQLQMFCL